eukprot:UN23855
MGTRAIRTKPRKPNEKILKKREQKWKEDQRIKQLQRTKLDDDVHSVEVYNYYKPKSKETTNVFGIFLQKLEKILGGQPRNLVREFAHETLTILKDEKQPVAHKKLKSINELFRDTNKKVSTESFTDLLNLSKQLNDFDPDLNTNLDDVVADAPQVPVIIEDDDPTINVVTELEEDSEGESSGEETTFKKNQMPADFQERE